MSAELNVEELKNLAQIFKFEVTEKYLEKIHPYAPFGAILSACKITNNLKVDSSKNELIELLTKYKFYADFAPGDITPIENEQKLRGGIEAKINQLATDVFNHETAKDNRNFEINKYLGTTIVALLTVIVAAVGIYINYLKTENTKYKTENTTLKVENEQIQTELKLLNPNISKPEIKN